MQIIKYICAALTAFKPAHYKPKFSFIKYYGPVGFREDGRVHQYYLTTKGKLSGQN